MKKAKTPPPFPTREQVLEFIRESPTPVGKREIARAFHIAGDRRADLKKLLAELSQTGAVDRGRKRRMAPPKALGSVAVVEISAIDPDGDLLCKPLDWSEERPPPRIILRASKRGITDLAPGNRVLVRLERISADDYVARPIRKLESGPARVLGVFERISGGSGRLRSIDKRNRGDLAVLAQHEGGAEAGELVIAEVLPSTRLGLKQAKIVQRLGDGSAPGAISLMAIHARDLPTEFSEAALAEADHAKVPKLAGREDLRDVPLVTIDGPDARDFDDAVWTEPDTDKENQGGWHLIVAIADVAHYVGPASHLDREAYMRGNSVYFPDRVVPMLPEALSNGLCSLKPGEPRACLAFHLWIDRKGKLLRHRLVRGLMRSAARLTYEQVQAAIDGAPDDTTGPLLEPVIRPLYRAYEALTAARAARGTLELDLPERKVVLDDKGRVASIAARARLDSHRLIEEFMIAANVAAAETLEGRGQAGLYRVHDQPDPVKLEAVRTFIRGLGQGLSLAKGQVITPAQLTRLLVQAKDLPEAQLISDIVLRAQAQAIYSHENIGHFGLALRRYAHFTSPIRRYADLIVHRALIGTLTLGPDGLDEQTVVRLPEIGAHISMTERRAAEAEREAVDRFTAAYLSERVGATFSGRISGVARFGLFVRLDETGADGIVPVSTLPQDFYHYEEAHHRLVGRRTGQVYRLADRVKVRLVEADPMTGSTVFRLIEDSGREPAPSRPSRPRARRRG
ncbi:MAG TPA: ribonuclease R [Alphaproteobacteria bacterium]|nr:ribonuclease R [Alphaproteobacteria bacterium]